LRDTRKRRARRKARRSQEASQRNAKVGKPQEQ
jgi:hypothetical protein